MAMFAIDTSDDVLIENYKIILEQMRNYHKTEHFSLLPDWEKEIRLKESYANWLIVKIILGIECEIVRFSIYNSRKEVNIICESIEEQKEYIETYKNAYKYFRKEVEKIMRDNFKDIYKKEKDIWNKNVLDNLKFYDWKVLGNKCYLPFFYKDGRFRPLKKEQYDYKNLIYDNSL
jgi:hypothetical protein